MVPYFLDFHENIRFSKALSEYEDQPYPLEKTATAFLDPPKKVCNIRRIFMEQSGNIPIFNILGTLFWNIPWNFTGNSSQIIWECFKRIFHEYPTNMYLPGGNKNRS